MQGGVRSAPAAYPGAAAVAANPRAQGVRIAQSTAGWS